MPRKSRDATQTEPGVKASDDMDVVLGATIRQRRILLKMSQEKLSEACNVSFQQLQKYEKGINRVSFSRLIQIATALNCRARDFLVTIEPEDGEPSGSGALFRPVQTEGAAELVDAYSRLPSAARELLLRLRRELAEAPK